MEEEQKNKLSLWREEKQRIKNINEDRELIQLPKEDLENLCLNLFNIRTHWLGQLRVFNDSFREMGVKQEYFFESGVEGFRFKIKEFLFGFEEIYSTTFDELLVHENNPGYMGVYKNEKSSKMSQDNNCYLFIEVDSSRHDMRKYQLTYKPVKGKWLKDDRVFFSKNLYNTLDKLSKSLLKSKEQWWKMKDIEYRKQMEMVFEDREDEMITHRGAEFFRR